MLLLKNNLPLLFAEALLFPKIFFALSNGAPVGALQCIMYWEFGDVYIKNGLAPLMDHIRVRLSDISLLTSKDWNYITWCVDAYVNKLLQNNVVWVAMDKGFNHLTNSGIYMDDSEFSLGFDELI